MIKQARVGAQLIMMSPASALAAAENAVCYFDDEVPSMMSQYETASEHSGDDEPAPAPSPSPRAPRLSFSARLAAATTAVATVRNAFSLCVSCAWWSCCTVGQRPLVRWLSLWL